VVTQQHIHATARRGSFQLPAIFFASLLLLGLLAPRCALSQTPSPLEEWQYPGGNVLYKLFVPDMPEWRVVLGVAEVAKPLYQGSAPYRLQTGPVIDVRYRDIAFASVGEGLGLDLLRGKNYRAGISVGYDLGRRESDYSSQLRGFGDIAPAPVLKLFESYAISKRFPLVLRTDVRQFIGGADGLVGDAGIFMPLPGSSKSLVMFAGPSITLADHLYMHKEFGVTPREAMASGFPVFDARGGADCAGLGFSATKFIHERWMINIDAAANRLLGSAGDSPITQRRTEGVVALSLAYAWF
jgi:outer membrane scaffolding protein for murein synthesis (MipA/OmpV family)